MKKNGNILINSFLGLTLVSIVVLGMMRNISRTTHLQDNVFERNLLVSFMDEVVEDYIPLVNVRFYDDTGDPVFYVNFNGEEANGTFANALLTELYKIDSSYFLNCESIKLPHEGNEFFYYEVSCVPPGATVEYVIAFDVSMDLKTEGAFYYILDYRYFEREFS